MTAPLCTDLVSELREACKSGRGNYGHRLLCGKAADEIERLRAGIRLIEVQDQGCGGTLTPSEIYRAMQRLCGELLR